MINYFSHRAEEKNERKKKGGREGRKKEKGKGRKKEEEMGRERMRGKVDQHIPLLSLRAFEFKQ